MTHKNPKAEAPPTILKTPDVTAAANQDNPRKSEPAAKAEEYGYIVTNQR